MTPSNSRYQRREQLSRVTESASATALARARPSADIEADILSEACRPGVGEPVTIHIRPAVYARMLAETGSARAQERRSREPIRIPFVVDEEIPSAPGYEIHRAVPQGWTCST